MHGNTNTIAYIFLICLFFSQGARRIVSEWVDLDSEARKFTAKILGEEVVPQEIATPPTPSHASSNEVSSEDELESKAELWNWGTDISSSAYLTKFWLSFLKLGIGLTMTILDTVTCTCKNNQWRHIYACLFLAKILVGCCWNGLYILGY